MIWVEGAGGTQKQMRKIFSEKNWVGVAKVSVEGQGKGVWMLRRGQEGKRDV